MVIVNILALVGLLTLAILSGFLVSKGVAFFVQLRKERDNFARALTYHREDFLETRGRVSNLEEARVKNNMTATLAELSLHTKQIKGLHNSRAVMSASIKALETRHPTKSKKESH